VLEGLRGEENISELCRRGGGGTAPRAEIRAAPTNHLNVGASSRHDSKSREILRGNSIRAAAESAAEAPKQADRIARATSPLPKESRPPSVAGLTRAIDRKMSQHSEGT